MPPCGAMGSTHVRSFPCRILSWGAGVCTVSPHPYTGALRYIEERGCQVPICLLTDKGQGSILEEGR
jgi:hypothetical protein